MINSLGLYLHIPFCKNKCPYCDFYSLADPEKTGDDYMRRYADALMLHMEDYSVSAQNRVIDTVYIGGGTPSFMPVKYMLDIIDSVKRNFTLLPDAEISMEVNPATVDYHGFRKYAKAGVNRISIGMQSAVDSELMALGRIHTFEDFQRAFYDARKAGIENINVDIMYGIPGQTEDTLRETLSRVIELAPEHISFYGLKIEDGTPFSKIKASLPLPDEDSEYKMYVTAVDILEKHGYMQYEISNFAKPGIECRHNLRYWNCLEYIGFGPGAHSYYNNHRFSFKKDIGLYISELEAVSSENSIVDEDYEIGESERIGEYVMLRFRLNDGIDANEFAERFGLNFERTYGKYLKTYTENGFMTKEGSRYAFTTAGRYVSNYILSAMIDFDDDITKGIADGSDK